jgi:uncharacterized membrane protein (DUF373 family)
MARMREWTEDAIEKAENVVYLAVAAVLVVVAAVVLGAAAVKIVDLPELGVITMAAEVLDLLLLVFIVVELLYAVRTTLAERELLAEPFLLVGIIASIKEIVVLSVKAPDYVGTDKLEDTIWLMGLLTLTIGVLAVATLLMRRKEREPAEGDGGGPDAAHAREADHAKVADHATKAEAS